jgi:hypothetical protein
MLSTARTREEVFMCAPLGMIFIRIRPSPNVSCSQCTLCFTFVCVRSSLIEQNSMMHISQVKQMTSNDWFNINWQCHLFLCLVRLWNNWENTVVHTNLFNRNLSRHLQWYMYVHQRIDYTDYLHIFSFA